MGLMDAQRNKEPAGQRIFPIVEQFTRARAAGVAMVTLDQHAQTFGIEAQRVAHAAVLDRWRAMARAVGIVGGGGSAGAIGSRSIMAPLTNASNRRCGS